MMTGILNQHPRTAIAFTNEDRKDYTNFWKEISMQD
jgi:4-hydroxy 2-oxovalerate aldolase